MTKFFPIWGMLFFMSAGINAHDVCPIEIDGDGGGYDFRPFKLSKVLNKNEIMALETLCDSFEFPEKEKNLFGKLTFRIKDPAFENYAPALLKMMSPLCFIPISEKTYYFLDEAHYIKGKETESFTYYFESENLGKKFKIDMCLYSIRGYHYASFSKEAIDICRDFMINLEESELNEVGELPFFIEKKIHLAKFSQKYNVLENFKILKMRNNNNFKNLEKLNNRRNKK